MVEPALVSYNAGDIGPLRSLEKGVQGGQDPGGALRAGDPAVVNANANRRQSETDGRDAAGRTVGAAIGDQAVIGIRRVPKVIEIGPLDVIQEFIVADKQMRRRRQGNGRGTLLGSGR